MEETAGGASGARAARLIWWWRGPCTAMKNTSTWVLSHSVTVREKRLTVTQELLTEVLVSPAAGLWSHLPPCSGVCGFFFTSYAFSLVEIFITDNSLWFFLCCASLVSLLITRSEADLFKDYKTGRAEAASSAGGLINAGAEKKPGLEEEKMPGGENGKSASD